MAVRSDAVMPSLKHFHMRTPSLCLTLLLSATTACPAEPGETFTSHADFYSHVANSEGLRSAWQRHALPPLGPTAQQLALSSLDKSWREVQLRTDSIVISGRTMRWVDLARPLGRSRFIELDLDLVQIWESAPATIGGPALCLESPAGSSASAARWHHVILIHRTSGSARPQAQAWTAPYASCGALWIRQGQDWVAGVFEFSFESEQFASKADFALHSLPSGHDLSRYVLTLPDPSNLFDFKAARVERR